MDTGQILQIIITVVVLIGVAAVALVCDILKTSNERLRRINLELRVRRDEEKRRTALALEQLHRLQAGPGKALPEAPSAPIAAASASECLPPPTDSTPPAPAAGFAPNGSAAAPAPALAPESVSLAEPPCPIVRAIALATPQVAPASIAGPLASKTGAPTMSHRRDWEQLLRNSSRRRVPLELAPPQARHKGELIPFESLQPSPESFGLPGGFHPYAALAHFLDSRSPFRGMVMAVGVNGVPDLTADAAPDDTLLDAVEDLLRDLLEAHEFCSPTGRGRFVILTPDRDAAAQRRFDAVLGQLWNFQLRRAFAGAQLFHCGGFEADGEPLSKGVAAAVAHMDANRGSTAAPQLETVRRRLAV
ncbi:MAG: hypothetical protein JSU00_21915 [Acidobacteria bacterium]|nr:hypothetical protein [Acidobacteriota bacterium]